MQVIVLLSRMAVFAERFVSTVLFALVIAALLLAGCNQNLKQNDNFPVVVGAKSGSDIQPCADYASHFGYDGRPYNVLNPETGLYTTRHEGMDFCTSTRAKVIASANGTIANLVWDDPIRGGRVTIEMRMHYDANGDGQKWPLYIDALHIKPKQGLEYGDEVKAGQVIGYTEPPGKPQIGPRSHIHLTAGPIPQTWNWHTDPNRFWQKGPGIVSCFDPNNPPNDNQIVAPLLC
jgi:hypothetical protein